MNFFSFHCEVNDNLKLIWILTTSSDKNLYPVFSELYVGRTHSIKKMKTFFDLIYNPNCANDKIRCTFVRSFALLAITKEWRTTTTTNDERCHFPENKRRMRFKYLNFFFDDSSIYRFYVTRILSSFSTCYELKNVIRINF